MVPTQIQRPSSRASPWLASRHRQPLRPRDGACLVVQNRRSRGSLLWRWHRWQLWVVDWLDCWVVALVSASDVIDLTAAAPACCIVSSAVLIAAAVSKLTESGPQSVISRNERTNFNLLFRLLIVAFWLLTIVDNCSTDFRNSAISDWTVAEAEVVDWLPPVISATIDLSAVEQVFWTDCEQTASAFLDFLRPFLVFESELSFSSTKPVAVISPVDKPRFMAFLCGHGVWIVLTKCIDDDSKYKFWVSAALLKRDDWPHKQLICCLTQATNHCSVYFCFAVFERWLIYDCGTGFSFVYLTFINTTRIRARNVSAGWMNLGSGSH